MLVSVCLLGSSLKCPHTHCQVYSGCDKIHLKFKSRLFFNSNFSYCRIMVSEGSHIKSEALATKVCLLDSYVLLSGSVSDSENCVINIPGLGA